MLGLVANNFVRVYHPYETKETYNSRTRQTETECVNGPGSLHGVTIDAAILAILHSFIVDNYNCGEQLGKLTVNGAIAQKYRGAVGTTGGTGYLKNYNYDSRLRYDRAAELHRPDQDRLGDRARDDRIGRRNFYF